MNINMIKKYRLTAMVGLAALVMGFVLGYTPRVAKSAAEKPENIELTGVEEERIKEVINSGDDNAPKLSKNAKITYEYYYLGDGITEECKESLPSFLIDMTEKTVGQSLGDWTMVSFTPEEIVVRKTLDQKSGQNYILGIYNGFIAVYYENSEDGEPALKEVTDRHINALSENEATALEEGVYVTGNDELFRLLQDYGS